MRPVRPALAASALAAVLCLAPAAHAHVVYDRPTLRQQAGEATVVAIVEFETPLSVWSAPDGSDHQEFFGVRRIETLKGTAPPERFDFFPHAEGEPGFRTGDRAIVFLEPTASRAEFLSLASRFPYFSVQRPGQEWTLPRAARSEAVELARAYADLPRLPDAEAADTLRALLLRGLRASEPRLRADALAELVRARTTPGLLATPEQSAPFVRLAGPGRLTVSERMALALVLEGAPGADPDRALRALAAEPLAADERAGLVRVAARRDDPALRAYVARCAADPDPTVRREAQAALARTAAVPAALAPSPTSPDSKEAPAP